jgi:hypothetical protein
VNIIERIQFIEKLSFKKQLVLALLCAERSYKEITKVFPTFVKTETSFQESLTKLWEEVNDKSVSSKENWQNLYRKIYVYFEEEEKDSFDLALLETSRVIYFVLGMLAWGEEVVNTSANCVEKTRKIMSEIYDKDNSREYSMKELEWLTKALYLIAESQELPTSYEWFLERIPDYERVTIHKQFSDIE